MTARGAPPVAYPVLVLSSGRSGRERGTPVLVLSGEREQMGDPCPGPIRGRGYPVLDLSREKEGGVSLSRSCPGGRGTPVQVLTGVPPRKVQGLDRDWGISSPRKRPGTRDWGKPPNCERTDRCENITSRRITYPGGKKMQSCYKRIMKHRKVRVLCAGHLGKSLLATDFNGFLCDFLVNICDKMTFADIFWFIGCPF